MSCRTPADRVFFFYAHFTTPVARMEWGEEYRKVLDRVRDDLEGSCLVIAYAGHSRNPKFIKERQRELREEYGQYFSTDLSIIAGDAKDILGPQFRGTVLKPPEECAYGNFMDINPDGNPEDIAQTCMDILADIAEAEPDEVYI